jgi:hypothetical protein
LDDKALPDQLTENTAQALLGDPQNAEQLAHGHLRMSSDEVNDAMMGTAKAVFREDYIGLCGKITIGEKQELNALADLLLVRETRGNGFYVRHIDLSRSL